MVPLTNPDYLARQKLINGILGLGLCLQALDLDTVHVRVHPQETQLTGASFITENQTEWPFKLSTQFIATSGNAHSYSQLRMLANNC